MATLLTLVCDIPPAGRTPPGMSSGFDVRPCRRSDIAALGELYFAAYDPGVAGANLAEATEDIAASYAGRYGELWPEASLVATAGSELVAAILVVQRAPWKDTPDCPFVIELFTARAHRRKGLASALLRGAREVAARHGRDCLALRVLDDNAGARDLYRRCGFREWSH